MTIPENMLESMPDFKIDDICQDIAKQGDYQTIYNLALVNKRFHCLCQKYLDIERERRQLAQLVPSIINSLSLSFWYPESLLSRILLPTLIESGFSVTHSNGDFEHLTTEIEQEIEVSPRFKRILKLIFIEHGLMSSDIKDAFEIKFLHLAEELSKINPKIIPLVRKSLVNSGLMLSKYKTLPTLHELAICLHIAEQSLGEPVLPPDFINTLRDLLIKTDFLQP